MSESRREKTQKTSETVFILDWDQTSTMLGGGTNEAASYYGFNYITASPETITQRFLVPCLADALKSELDSGHMVFIGTSQPMKQIIRRALVCLLGERADEITILCGPHEKLAFVLKIYPEGEFSDFLKVKNLDWKIRELAFNIPLHTKEIENFAAELSDYAKEEIKKFIEENKDLDAAKVEANWQPFTEALLQALEKRIAARGVGDDWVARYAKDDWDVDDVKQVIALMDRLGVKNIGVRESDKEDYLWEALKSRFFDTTRCKKIVYLDDSARRLAAFAQKKPAQFYATELSCVVAIPNQNHHFAKALALAGKPLVEFSLENLHELPANDARLLCERLRITPVRLKKFTEKSGLHHFFVTPAAVKKLPRTIVNLGDDCFMIIGNVPRSAGIGQHSKVKSQTIIKIGENAQSFEIIKQGLVKIHFYRNTFGLDKDGWENAKAEFVASVKTEAASLTRFNGLHEHDIKLRVCEVAGKGLRIYMSMPSLGISLFNAEVCRGLDELTQLRIFYKTLERVEQIHVVGTVHFDLTLNNILYDKESGAVRICDFGLARRGGQSPMTPNKTINPPYFADALEDSIHFSSAYDVFSLGVSMAQFLGFEMREQKMVKRQLTFLLGSSYEACKKAVSKLLSLASELYDDTENLTNQADQSYQGADDLFDFSYNPRITNKKVIDLLKEMLDPDPRKRPSVTTCKIRLRAFGLWPEAVEINNAASLPLRYFLK